jgi:hypothetical protein
MGDFVRALHEEHGVVFHLEDTPWRHRGQAGEAEEWRHARGRPRVMGVGVRPRLDLGEKAA